MGLSEGRDCESRGAKAKFIELTGVDPDSDPRVQLAVNLGAMARDLTDGLEPAMIGADDLKKALDEWLDETRAKIKRRGASIAKSPYYLDLVRRVVERLGHRGLPTEIPHPRPSCPSPVHTVELFSDIPA